MQRRLEVVSGANGVAQAQFAGFWKVAGLLVYPAGGFWSVLVRGPRDGDTIDCPPLPAAGPLAWWHETMGIDAYLDSRGAGVKVGVIDTGVGPHPNLDHATDIGAFIDGGHDAGGGADVDSHGSHVCGTIGARPDPAGQYAGIAPGIELFSARVFPPDRGANQGDIANAIDALSADHGVDLINMSLGAETGSQIEHDAIRDADERGTLCVCAAANEGSPPVHFPADFAETVAVSAVGLPGWGPAGTLASMNVPSEPDKFGDDNLYLANFSNYGPEITCGAPGSGIIATVPARYGLTAPYAAMSGTSMASPAACGALAGLLSADADYQGLPRNVMRTEMARSILGRNCRDVGLKADYQGRGIPDV